MVFAPDAPRAADDIYYYSIITAVSWVPVYARKEDEEIAKEETAAMGSSVIKHRAPYKNNNTKRSIYRPYKALIIPSHIRRRRPL